MNSEQKSLPPVSVILCTYNRHALLERTLESACGLNAPSDRDWELLVIDNNSPDRTREAVEKFIGRIPVRYIFEPRQGKTCALNRGIQEAHGEFLVFTDDDVQFDPAWLTSFVDAEKRHPEIGWFGGRISPDWEHGRPSWLHDDCLSSMAGFFGLYDLGNTERLYTPADPPPAGPCMAVRRATFARIGNYREDLGPRGGTKGTCDDSELIWRAQEHHVDGMYLPGPLCAHFVPTDRLTLSWFFRYGVGKGSNMRLMHGADGQRGSLLRAMTQGLRAVPQALRGRWDRVRVCSLNMGMEIGKWKTVPQTSTP